MNLMTTSWHYLFLCSTVVNLSSETISPTVTYIFDIWNKFLKYKSKAANGGIRN